METGRHLIFIVAYNAERHIASVFRRIPYDRLPKDCSILLIDDASPDSTYRVASEAARECPIPTVVLKNPVNLGYGGNQKLGYEYALRERFDSVVLIHGDGQYAPELIPEMLAPIIEGQGDVVLGSRMMRKQDAIKGGMPLYKWIGNQVLTWLENRILGMDLSEFHTGLRAYRVGTLGRIPFHLNSNDFHFDTDILIQCHRSGARFHEIPIPTRYGDEVCHVNGWKYFFDCLKSCVRDWMTRKGIFYCRKFDVDEPTASDAARVDLAYSPEKLALGCVTPQSEVLQLGGGKMTMAAALFSKKQCQVTVADRDFPASPPPGVSLLDVDLSRDLPNNVAVFESVLALDVLEHLPRRRQIALLESLRKSQRPQTQFLVSVPNTAFLPLRVVFFFLGHLNYGRRGILDDTHNFLFTLKTFRELLTDCGFSTRAQHYSPAPYELAFGSNCWTRLVTRLNRWLAKCWPSLFAYQVLAECYPLPTVDELLGASFANSRALGAASGDGSAPDLSPRQDRRGEGSPSA